MPAAGSSLGRHVRRTIVLALPIVLSRAGTMLLITTDTLAAGRLGGIELAAIGLGLAPQIVAFMIMMGALQVTVLLAATALGEKRPDRIGEILVTALAHAFLLGLASTSLALVSEPLFLALGQDPVVAARAAEVAHAHAFGVPAFMVFMVAAMVIETIGRPVVATAIILGVNLLNIGLDLALIRGLLPGLEGAPGLVATTSALRVAAMAAALGWLLREARRSTDGFGIIAALGRAGSILRSGGGDDGRRIRRLGLPMGLAQGVESAAFNAILMVAGTIAPAALAAHQATMTVVTLSYMVAVGYSGAAAIRVGNALGARNLADLRRAAWTPIALEGLTGLAFGALLHVYAQEIAAMLTSDPAVIAVLATTLPIAAMLLAFDGMMGVALGVLRGIGDAWWPLILQALAFWLVALPVAHVVAVRLGHGAAGLQVAIFAGVAVSFAMLAVRIVARTRTLPQPG